MYKIVITGAATLIGRELKDALADSSLAAADVVLLDDEGAQGQLDQVGDEITFVQAVSSEAFERADLTFFCGAPEATRLYWRRAIEAGSSVLDLSGALSEEPGVLVRAPWLGLEAPALDLTTAAVTPADPAALVLALLMERLQRVGAVRFAAATVLLPASDFGRAAMDELHQQAINLLSFQSLSKEIYDAQAAYNLLCGLGEEAKISLAATEARIRRHYALLSAGRWPSLSLQLVHAPVFHGHSFSIAVEMERPVEIAALEETLGGAHIDLILEDTDSPSNLAATGQDDLLVRLRPERDGRNPNLVTRFWLWAASDNLLLYAQNALECAAELSRLRPKGGVQ